MKFIKNTYRKPEKLNESFMDHEKILAMRSRLQMLIALILFTPTILSSLGSGSLLENKSTLTWGIIVAVYIGIYILCEALEDRINKLYGNLINWSVWVHLGAFIPFFVCIGLYQDVISGLPLIIFAGAMAIVFGLPLLVAVVLGIIFALGEFFTFVRTVRDDKK
jgi:hypothetical protein